MALLSSFMETLIVKSDNNNNNNTTTTATTPNGRILQNYNIKIITDNPRVNVEVNTTPLKTRTSHSINSVNEEQQRSPSKQGSLSLPTTILEGRLNNCGLSRWSIDHKDNNSSSKSTNNNESPNCPQRVISWDKLGLKHQNQQQHQQIHLTSTKNSVFIQQTHQQQPSSTSTTSSTTRDLPRIPHEFFTSITSRSVGSYSRAQL